MKSISSINTLSDLMLKPKIVEFANNLDPVEMAHNELPQLDLLAKAVFQRYHQILT